VSTVNVKWPDDYTAWWYASWYGWLPSAVGWEVPEEELITVKELVDELGGPESAIASLQLKYYNTTEKLSELYNMTVEEITKILVFGSIEFNGKTYEMEEGNVDQYWDLQKISMALGVRDSQKVFLTEVQEFFATNKERVLNIAADVSSGLWTRWSLITAETPDKVLRVAEYSSQNTLFMDAFNPIGGISDVYSAVVWRVIYDSPMYTDLTTGTYIPVRCDYTVERGNITVPSDAVIYNSTIDQWVAAHAGEPVKARIIYNCKLSNWHDGHPMTMADVKYAAAFTWEWSTKDGDNDPYYDDKLASAAESLAKIKGIEWVDEDTYVVYTDLTHPVADDVTANMNVFWASQPWQLLYAESELVAKGDEYGASQKYSFSEEAEGVAQLDLLVKDHVADLKKVLEALKAKNAVPSAIADDVSDPSEGYTKIIDWINSKGHAVISNGPFYLDYYDPDSIVIELRAFRDPTYPFTIDEIKQMIGLGDYNPPTVLNFEINPTTVEVGNTTTISWAVADESEVTEVSLIIDQPNGTTITETFDPSLGVYSYEYTVLDTGTYTATVRAVDKWGNVNEVSMEFYGKKTIVETVTVNETTSNVTVQEEDLELGIDVNETAVSNETQIIINATVTTNEEEIIQENASSLAVAPVVSNTTDNETQAVAPIKYVVVDVTTANENTTAEDVVEKYTLKIKYDEAELGTIDESTLSLYYWNGSAWIRVADYVNKTIPNGPFVYDAGVNTVENYVWAVVNHFSVYALGGVSKPVLTILSPEDGAEFYTNTTANVTVKWTAEDELGIDHYEVKLNDGPWIKTGNTEYTFYDLPEGEYTVYVRAVNLGGEYSEATITFKVVKPELNGGREKAKGRNPIVMFWLMYKIQRPKFDQLYATAVDMGVDNETLSQAMNYIETADKYYEEGMKIGHPLQKFSPKQLRPFRLAYVNLSKAIKLLEKAINELEKS
ncbi:Ig-like domain-containing protein, partial [Thermococcus alcaliphilus]|uniref:Ig-like domain-containing protein n=1 Tax=Thermococcus alcaliphilus TaxID=139207 RepID=UPI0020905424